MKMDTFNELKKESFKKPSFLVMENGVNKVVNELDNLGFKDKKLIDYMNELENGYNDKIKALEERLTNIEKINKELLEAVKSLNK